MNKFLAARLYKAMIILMACALFGPLAAYAQLNSISHDAATVVAENWLRYNSPSRSSGAVDSSVPAMQELFYNGELVGYVASAGIGYVIIPAYQELPPITAYSTEVSFNVTDEGGFVELVKEELAYKKDVAQSVLTASAPVPEMEDARTQIEQDRRDWQTYSASYDEFKSAMDARKLANPLDDTMDVGPLLSSSWHQGAPYNNLCPMGYNGRTVVGCVATAMGQILKFWSISGSGSHSYNWAGDNSCGSSTPGATLSATFSDGYDWANALGNATTSSSAAVQASVSEISYECGVAVNMMYGHCGSGAYVPTPVVSAFQSYFGMATGMQVRARSSYTAATWFTMLQEDLNAGHPGFYTIASHAIVLDGYRVYNGLNQVHMNYGWADSHTTWYTVDGLYCAWSGCNPQVEQVIRYIHPAGGTPPPSSIAVGSPNGAESWAAGSTHAITWTSSNLTENVKIELNRGYPASVWETLVTSTANTGTYSWAVSGTSSSVARIRITGTTHTTVGDTSNANFSITVAPPPSALTLSAPNGGESWAVGTAHAILWTSSNLSGNVSIELNRSYPAGAWETISAGTANTGVYTWTIAGAASSTARIRIRGVTQPSVGDTSNASFTITSSGGTGTYTVAAPNGAEIFTLNSWRYILWSSSGYPSTSYVSIQINRSYPTGAWETITAGTPNDGAYIWPVSGAVTLHARIRVRNLLNPAAGDLSNADFTISAGFGNQGPMTSETGMESASPNPFNPTTQIRFNLAEPAHVKLDVYDITGRLVAALMDAPQEAGAHAITLDGSTLATGLYFVRMSAGNYHSIQKIQLLK